MPIACFAKSYLIEVRGLKLDGGAAGGAKSWVVPYRGTWVETLPYWVGSDYRTSYLIEVRGLKRFASRKR